MFDNSPLPPSIAKAIADLDEAFFRSVPFKRVGLVREARERLEAAVAAAISTTATDAFHAAARICESRSRTLKSKPASFEALNCGAAIERNGAIELQRLRSERLNGAHSPDACATDQPSVGMETP